MEYPSRGSKLVGLPTPKLILLPQNMSKLSEFEFGKQSDNTSSLPYLHSSQVV